MRWLLLLLMMMLRLQRHPHTMFTTMSFSFGTALHMAAFRGNTYAVERLLERRADAASRRVPWK